jgi:hypothetical protein
MTETEEADWHWYHVVLPQLMREARGLRNIISGIVARKSSPDYLTIGVPILLELWEYQYQSLSAFAYGSEPPLCDKVNAILAERQEVMSKLRKRLREVKSWRSH